MTHGIAELYLRQLQEARDIEQARERLADLICGERWKASGQMLLIFKLDALIEGFAIHNALGGVLVGREELLRLVRALS